MSANNDSLFEKSEIAVVYATYKQGLWGPRWMHAYIGMLYGLLDRCRYYTDGGGGRLGLHMESEVGLTVEEVEGRIDEIVDMTYGHEFDDAYDALERLWGDLNQKYTQKFLTKRERRMRSHEEHHVNYRADYSTYSGNEFVDMLGLGPEDFGY